MVRPSSFFLLPFRREKGGADEVEGFVVECSTDYVERDGASGVGRECFGEGED
jgi:hypothetical protein